MYVGAEGAGQLETTAAQESAAPASSSPGLPPRRTGLPWWLTGPSLVAVLVSLTGPVYLAVSWNAQILPAWVGWLPLFVSIGLALATSVRTIRTPALGPDTRRFWWRLTLAAAVVGVAIASQGYDALAGPDAPTQRVSPVTSALFLTGLAVLMYAVVGLPRGHRPGSERLTFLLDAGSVIVGSVLLAFHLSFETVSLWRSATGTMLSLIGVITVGFIGVLALMKLAFSGVRTADPWSLRLLGIAALGGAGFGALSPLMADRPYLNSSSLAIPMAYLFFALAAERQRRHPTTAPQPVRTGTHRFSQHFVLLPYLAVGVTDLLLLTRARNDVGVLVVALGVTVLTCLVVARQLVAFRENARLLQRLDSSVEQLRDSQQQLSHQATHDTLTGLANRTLFSRRVGEVLATASDPTTIAVVLVDLDEFKVVNDHLGHDVGDALLISAGERLRQAVDPTETVARIGADEFALLLEDLRSGQLPGRVRQIIDSLGEPLVAADQHLLARASLGVAEGAPGVDSKELLRRADVAMHVAKNQAEGDCAQFVPEMDARSAEHARIGSALRSGLNRGEFVLNYQPIVSLPDGHITGVEALVRWAHPEWGTVRPDMFIPIAERSGLIVPLGRWILREACRQAAEWRQQLGEQALRRISINVSPRQLADPTLVGDVADALATSGLPAEAVTIEVTETAVFAGGVAIDALNALRAMGVRIALDDFGTGHSSLDMLLSCPVDILKLDKSFVEGVAGSHRQAVIARFVNQVAEGLVLETVAEGVEEAAQARRLHELGYRYAQGYHFFRPLPGHVLAELLALDHSVA